jgi:hypothetical protein
MDTIGPLSVATAIAAGAPVAAADKPAAGSSMRTS